jgi:hypothetical protein
MMNGTQFARSNNSCIGSKINVIKNIRLAEIGGGMVPDGAALFDELYNKVTTVQYNYQRNQW